MQQWLRRATEMVDGPRTVKTSALSTASSAGRTALRDRSRTHGCRSCVIKACTASDVGAMVEVDVDEEVVVDDEDEEEEEEEDEDGAGEGEGEGGTVSAALVLAASSSGRKSPVRAAVSPTLTTSVSYLAFHSWASFCCSSTFKLSSKRSFSISSWTSSRSGSSPWGTAFDDDFFPPALLIAPWEMDFKKKTG